MGRLRQRQISKEMTLEAKIKVAMMRSEHAYNTYLKGRRYFEANRIYTANKHLYPLLVEYLYKGSNYEITEKYLNHLDDWFLQFDKHVQLTEPELIDEFIFERPSELAAFPNQFKNLIK